MTMTMTKPSKAVTLSTTKATVASFLFSVAVCHGFVTPSSIISTPFISSLPSLSTTTRSCTGATFGARTGSCYGRICPISTPTTLRMATGGGGSPKKRKRKRRRRKGGSDDTSKDGTAPAPAQKSSLETSSPSSPSISPTPALEPEEDLDDDVDVVTDDVEEDELPEFDLEESSSSSSSSSSMPRRKKLTPEQLREIMESDEITPSMMGKPTPLGTVQDLLSNRELEKFIIDDEPTDLELEEKELANLEQMEEMALRTLQAGKRVRGEEVAEDYEDEGSGREEVKMGKKRARAEARRAAAIAAREAEEAKNQGFFSNLPFMGSNDEEDEGGPSPLKIIEYGTWVGIFLLIAWEIYINSPFFDRAAPMAPIVYEFLL